MNLPLSIPLLALVGLIASIDIYRKKHSKKEIQCAFNTHCERVILSKYGQTMGIGNEFFGMAYYLSVILVSFFIPLPLLLTQIVSLATVLASLYLVYVQTKVLKEYCLMCLLSAGVNTAIFLVLLLSQPTYSNNQTVTMMNISSYDLVIDVREQDEWDMGFIEGALHIPLAQIESGVSALDVNENASILLYCARGTRSKKAQNILKEAGFNNVYSLDGGYIGYNQAN